MNLSQVSSLAILLIMSAACGGSPTPEALSALKNGEIRVIGHGGNGTRSLNPLNGISGIHCTLANGADGVEVDIRLTADDTLVLYHDHELNRGSHCIGTIEDSQWSSIRDCEHRALLADDTLMTLNQLIHYPLMKGKSLSLDVKFKGVPDDEMRMHMVNAISNALSHRSDGVNLIESQDRVFLQMCALSEVKARRLLYTVRPDEDAAALKHDSIDGVSIDMALISPGNVLIWRNAGMFVMLWGASTRKRNIEALNMRPHAIQSDRPSHLCGLRDN